MVTTILPQINDEAGQPQDTKTIEAAEEATEVFAAEEEEAVEATEVPASLDFKVHHLQEEVPHQEEAHHRTSSTVTFMANAATTITNAILKMEDAQNSMEDTEVLLQKVLLAESTTAF